MFKTKRNKKEEKKRIKIYEKIIKKIGMLKVIPIGKLPKRDIRVYDSVYAILIFNLCVLVHVKVQWYK